MFKKNIRFVGGNVPTLLEFSFENYLGLCCHSLTPLRLVAEVQLFIVIKEFFIEKEKKNGR